MHKIFLAVLAVTWVTQVHAGDVSEKTQTIRNQQQNNFFGQRPYQVAPEEKSTGATQPWEGATLVTPDPEQAEKALMRHNQHQMNFIGRRPYLAPHKGE